MFGPEPPGRWTSQAGFQPYRHLIPGARYRVAEAFTDHDGDLHPSGETWRYLGYSFLPYHDGLSLFVSLDGAHEWQIRFQTIAEEQGPIVGDLERYVVRDPTDDVVVAPPSVALPAPVRAPRRRRWALPAAWLAGGAALVVEGLVEWVWTVGVQTNGPRGMSYGEAYYVVANWYYGLSVLVMFLVFAGVYLLLDTLIRADYRRLVGWSHLALTVLGMALVFEPSWWMRLGGLPRRYEDFPSTFQTANALSVAGYDVTLAGLGLFLCALASLLLRRLSPRLNR